MRSPFLLGAGLSNASRAPSSRASRGTTCIFWPFFAGGAGLLGACSHFSDTLLVRIKDLLNLRYVLCFGKRQHHEDARLGRHQVFDRDNRGKG